MAELSQNVKQGFEGVIFIGTAGSTATNQITNAINANGGIKLTKGETTPRGDSTVVPLETSDATKRTFEFSFNMINDKTDTNLQTILAAAAAGSGIALRTKDRINGKGYDGDCIVEVEHDMPLDKAQDYKFTFHPSRSYGRNPNFWT